MAAPSKEENASQISALLAERKGYEVHGPKDRLAAVDAELKRLGYEAKTKQQRASKRPAQTKASTR